MVKRLIFLPKLKSTKQYLPADWQDAHALGIITICFRLKPLKGFAQAKKEKHFCYLSLQEMHLRNPAVFLILLVVLKLVSAGVSAQNKPTKTQTWANGFEDSLVNNSWLNPGTIVRDSMTGNHYSEIKGSASYTAGLETDIPKIFHHKNFLLSLSALVQTNLASNTFQCVLSATSGDSLIFWKGFQVKDSIYVTDAWNNFSMAQLIPGNFPADTRLKVFFWNNDSGALLRIDNLMIKIEEVRFPTFLPRL